MMIETIKNRVNISPEEMDYALEFIVGATLSIVKHWFDQEKNIPMHQLLPLMYKLMDNRFVQELDIDLQLLPQGTGL
ncbi:MAG: TetR family transcriptional regulator C-terminal domain-containing protein, partial [Spirochaetes bacterium]|nr:TetR family transcriptional regulator C-terminal domain-containing protein [Spirochaetota bacterium]